MRKNISNKNDQIFNIHHVTLLKVHTFKQILILASEEGLLIQSDPYLKTMFR